MSKKQTCPPFHMDIAGALCAPTTLSRARELYRNEAIGPHELRAIEENEVRQLVTRLKSGGMEVITDGGYFRLALSDDWDTFIHTAVQNFSFLTGIAGGNVWVKQQLPSPGTALTQRLSQLEQPFDTESMQACYDDTLHHYLLLMEELALCGCRYIQFDESRSEPTELTSAINNQVIQNRAEGMYIAFHANTPTLQQLHQVDAYFLNYQGGYCDRARLLWFVRQNESAFGFVLSHHPQEEDLDEWQAHIDDVLNYIPRQRFVLCLPEAHPSVCDENDLSRQWESLRLAAEMAKRVWE